MKIRKKISKVLRTVDKHLQLGQKRYIFYFTASLGLFIFILSGLITRGQSFANLFLSSRTNYFMDFFNPLSWLFNGAYTYGASIYPPLPLTFYKIMLRFVPYDIVSQGALAIKASQPGQIVFLFYTLLTLLTFIFLLSAVKSGLKLEKYLFAFLTLFSAPFLFQFERANIIFVALLFLMIFVLFKDCKNRIIRELAIVSLAISGAIKIYPLIFGLLLIKERRYKDFFKVFIYCISLFVLPFFVIGGISQLPILVRNVFSTSDLSTSWGVGYTVNIQNIIRILFGLFGYFGKDAVLIGNVFSVILLILSSISALLLRSKWKTVALLSLLMIMVPNISFEYTLIFMIIPLIIFLDNRENMQRRDYIYLACFILFFIPLALPNIDSLNRGFGSSARPLTYGVLIQDIALVVMATGLILEGLATKFVRKILSRLLLKTSNKLKKMDRFYWIIPVFVILIYNLVFFNKFLPITEGWFSTYAWLFNNGQFPYKDFYFFLTPFYLIKMSVFTTIFGYGILPLRIFGIGVILLTTYFLYKNLEIIFGTAISAFVTVVGIIYYQSGNAHITYDFIQFVTLYGLIQSYFLLRFIKSSDSKKTEMKWLLGAGFFASLAFLTKQSNGLIIAAIPLVGICFLSFPKGMFEIFRVIKWYALGFVIPISVIFLWLFINSAFPQFIQQVFLGGTSSKGGLDHILFSWMGDLLTYNFLVRFLGISLIFLIFGYWINFFKVKNKENESMNRVFIFVSSLFMFAIVLLPLTISVSLVNRLSALGQLGGQFSLTNTMIAAISISIICVIIAIVFAILKKPFNKYIFLFSFMSLSFIYGTGTSAGISEAGTFAGFCLFIGLLLYLRSIGSIGKIMVVIFCMSFSLMWVGAKYENPYYWWNLNSIDIRAQLTKTDEVEELAGLYTSPSNVGLIEKVSSDINKYSKPDNTLLTFPSIPVFYLVSDRKPLGKALVYWFDFLPDDLALKEADVIKRNPPKVIVYLDLGKDVWTTHERLFRDGKLSGQRKVNDTIKEVIKSQKMQVVDRFELSHEVSLTVWRN